MTNIENILKNFKNKNYKDALRELNKILIIDPNSVEKLNLKGVILQALNKPEEARKNWIKSLSINNKYFDAYFNLGNSYMDEKNYKQAEIYYNQAAICQPQNFKIYYQLGFLCMKKNELQKSYNFFNKSINYNNNFAPTYYNLGIALSNLNKKNEAINCLIKAIEINPKYIDAFFLLGITFREIKKFSLSKKYFLEAFKLNPDYPYLKGAIRFIKNTLCEWDDFEKDLFDLENDVKNKKKVTTPWQGLSLFESPAIQLQNTILFSEQQKENSFNVAPNQKINIGYFSANFCEHAVSNQLGEILKMHDKNKFNTFGFYLGKKIDNKLKEIKKNFNDFFDISQIETSNIIQLVRDLKIDIAVDLMGYTKSNRYKIFNNRCAPIQVSYLGYAGTTGLKNMDYLIADESVILNDYRKYYSEKIIYMPNSFMPNNENQVISKKQYTKKSEGLPENGIVYCCFNKHYKITPKIFDVWIDILKNVENSILWLNSAEEDTKKNILEYSRQKGLSQKKIFFTERTLGYPEYLSKHQLADIFLDTSPFSAHSTGCASLLAGVPIITISGKSYANNVCSSLLRSIGMGELIAENLTEYKDKAIYLGKNLDKLLNIKKKIKNNNMGKSLFDSKTYTKDLEKAFSQIYKTKKNKLQNEDLRVNQL
jgi:predicted O-linked N-acetylglucosamine transferase (SPINDLY family)